MPRASKTSESQPAAKRAATAPAKPPAKSAAKPVAQRGAKAPSKAAPKKTASKAGGKPAKPTPKKKSAKEEEEDEDEEDYDYDYDAEDYDYDAEEEEDEEEDEEDENDEDEGEDEEEEDEDEDQKEANKKKVGKAGLAKIEEETVARFGAIEQRFNDFIEKVMPLFVVHEAYSKAQKSGGWCCKADLDALTQRTDELEKQTSVFRDELARQDAINVDQEEKIMGRFGNIEQSAAGAQAQAESERSRMKKVLEDWVTEEFAQLEKKLAAFSVSIADETASREQLQGVVQQAQNDTNAELSRIETKFSGASQNCLACGMYSPPTTAIGTSDMGLGPRRNRVGAPVSQFLSREWEHDKYDPTRPRMNKGGGFSTTATSFFSDSFQKQMSASKSSPIIDGSRRKRNVYDNSG